MLGRRLTGAGGVKKNAGMRMPAFSCLAVLAKRAAQPVQPRPTKGMLVAMSVMNCTLASSGRRAIAATACAT